MLSRPIRHRRGRRGDFAAIVEVLAASGISAPPPDRSALRRFRRIVADLGADLYVALAGVRLVGFVHVTYTRHIVLGTRARIEALVVAPDSRRSSVGRSLVQLARQRAVRRGCSELRCSAGTAAARHFLTGTGWQSAGDEFRVDLGSQPRQ